MLKAVLRESLIWRGLKLVGGVVGFRMRVLTGSGVGSGRFFGALVVVVVAEDGVSCSTMLA
jgi:hypothetical protein